MPGHVLLSPERHLLELAVSCLPFCPNGGAFSVSTGCSGYLRPSDGRKYKVTKCKIGKRHKLPLFCCVTDRNQARMFWKRQRVDQLKSRHQSLFRPSLKLAKIHPSSVHIPHYFLFISVLPNTKSIDINRVAFQ